jgi:hypothetical protein
VGKGDGDSGGCEGVHSISLVEVIWIDNGTESGVGWQGSRQGERVGGYTHRVDAVCTATGDAGGGWLGRDPCTALGREWWNLD